MLFRAFPCGIGQTVLRLRGRGLPLPGPVAGRLSALRRQPSSGIYRPSSAPSVSQPIVSRVKQIL
jgi:hypothetical protein